jgi:regulator of ribonuclease activity A
MADNTTPGISTPDIADEYPEQVFALELPLRNFGAHHQFCGSAVTVKCHEDNSLIKQLVATPGEGRVIVVDGGGSRRRALLGDMLAEEAARSGWAGLVINGVVRDVDQISVTPLGVQALGATPLKTAKLGAGQRDITIHLGGVSVSPGNYIYADNNGVLVAREKLF